MVTDRELLELAAKAAGLTTQEPLESALYVSEGNGSTFFWDPLYDDGDALRLLCKLSLQIVESRGGAVREVICQIGDEDDDDVESRAVEIEWPHTPAATRRAIVRAAAEIGKAKP